MADAIDERLKSPEHINDKGPPQVWDAYSSETLYAFVHKKTNEPAGIAETSGPPDQANAGWWIDSKFRGQGYGNELIDLLAAELKRNGFIGVGNIKIDTWHGQYDSASAALKRRFIRYFK